MSRALDESSRRSHNDSPPLKRQANSLQYSNMNKTEGYDEIFDPPLENKYECPICLLGLREPVQTECGHRFCRACILHSLRNEGFKCPVDNVPLTESNLFPDNFAKREINSFNVHCRLYKERGCPWKGPFKDLEDHVKNCPFSGVKCPNACGIRVQIQELEKHMEKDCPNRTIECPFCHQNIFVAVAEEHNLRCPEIPINCEKCGKRDIHQNQMDNHLEVECPKAKSKCPTFFLGCKFEGYNPEVSKHIAENHVQHFKDIAKAVQKLQEEQRVTSVMSAGTYIWKIDNLQQCRTQAIENTVPAIYSSPFYTSMYGYKMCLRMNLNGVDSGFGHHISLFVHMMKGDWDDILEWPFTGRITLAILDQSENVEFRRPLTEKTFVAKPNLLSFQKPTKAVEHQGHGSVAHNDIQVLTFQAFYGLDNLTKLDISMNPLRSFTGDPTSSLPSLSLLNAIGIVDWKPDKHLFQLRMLERIVGPTWSADCENCTFYKSNSSLSLYRFYNMHNCYVHIFGFTDLTPFERFLKNISFRIHCKNTLNCRSSGHKISLLKTQNRCWDETVAGINFQSPFGFIGLVVNLVVVLNILSSKTLRNNISMLFVCNMAVSDFLLSVYTISITAYLNSVSFAYMNSNSDQHCWKMGSLWMLGETGSIITAFFLTLERYLVIVYSLNPDIRITRKMAAILISVCWLVAIVFTAIALHYNFYKMTFLCIPFRLELYHIKIFIFTVAIAGIGLILYILTFVFYIHIYTNVKQTAQDAGVQRESKLAKRIAMLVFSNIFFFCFPVIISGIILVLDDRQITSEIDDLVIEMSAKVLPAICLSLNSFLNPFLYAFRNDRFIQALKGRFQCLQPVISGILACIRRDSRVNPENLTANVERS